MTIQTALNSYLLTQSTITAIVAAEVYQGFAPEGATLPRIVFSRVSRQAFDHLGGASGLVRSRVQIDSYATTPDAAQTLAEAIRATLHGYSGSMGSEALIVRSSTIGDQRSKFIDPIDASSVGVFLESQDFMIAHHETIPTF